MSGQKLLGIQRMVVFKVGKEIYGLDIYLVNEIIKMQEITPIPDTKEYIKGIINLRGKIVPVVSLQLRLGIEESEPGKKSRIIIVDMDDYEVGIIVDEVFKVVASEVQSADREIEEMLGDQEGFFEQIQRSDYGIIGILNLQKVLGCEDSKEYL